MMNGQNGKGDSYRPVDWAAWDRGWELAFGKKRKSKQTEYPMRKKSPKYRVTVWPGESKPTGPDVVKPSKIELRCSSLPLFFDCPPAVLNPDNLIQVRVVNGSENLGTDIHAAIQHTIETGEVNFRKIEGLYSAEDVERARVLFHNGLAVVAEAKQDLVDPKFEVEVKFETEKYVVTGHVDLLDIRPHDAFVVDFKTGRTRDNHYHQMAGYAAGAWESQGRPAEFTVRVACVYLEDRTVTNYTFTAEDLRKWRAALDAVPVRYAVNRRCVYCPLNDSCSAFRCYLTGSIKTIEQFDSIHLRHGGPIRSVRSLSPEDRSKLMIGLKMADTAVKRCRSAIKDEAMVHGDLDLGNGSTYSVRLRTTKTPLTKRVMGVMSKFVTADDIVRATTLSLPALITAALARVKPPLRAALKQKIEEALDKDHAVVYHTVPFLETVSTDSKGQPCRKTLKKPARQKPSPCSRSRTRTR